MIRLEGELTQERVPALAAALPAQADALDLSGVTRVDSAGLALLLELARRARARGQTLRCSAAPEQLRALAGFFGIGPLLGLDRAAQG